MEKSKVKKRYIFLTSVLLLVSAFIFAPILHDSSPSMSKEIPYIADGNLYLSLKMIPIKNIIKVEIVKNPILYIIVHYKTGMCTMSFKDYLKIMEKLNV